MSATVSVIVPVYKVEQYLDKCVQSILNQTFSDFELILVDDGSPDRCPQMCDDWAERDDRIKVAHQKNSGVQEAIKHGISLACGEYLAFVDSDDWVEPEYLQVLHDGIVKYKADIVQCNYQRVSEENVQPHHSSFRIIEEEEIKNDILPSLAKLQIYKISDTRWAKLYKMRDVKSVIHLWGSSVRLGEDTLFNFAVLGVCKRVVVLDSQPLYDYRYHTSSVMGSFDLECFLNQDELFENIEKISKEYNFMTENIEIIRTRRYSSYIYAKAISDQPRAERKKEIQRIISVLDRDKWLEVIKGYESPVARISNYLYYYGCVDLMLLIMDAAKKIRGLFAKE